jgi:hypothetical protein
MERKQQQNKSNGENNCKRKMGHFIRKNDGERKVLGKMKDEPKKRKMMEIQDVSRLVQ